MEILDNVIEQLKNLEDDGERAFEEDIFPIRRLVESEKARQLKEGTRIKVSPLEYSCEFCTHFFNDPEKFYLHLVQKHICPAEEARKKIDEQQQEYQTHISTLEELTQKYTEVMLDVDYTDEIRNN
jgi:hypothetical protein